MKRNSSTKKKKIHFFFFSREHSSLRFFLHRCFFSCCRRCSFYTASFVYSHLFLFTFLSSSRDSHEQARRVDARAVRAAFFRCFFFSIEEDVEKKTDDDDENRFNLSILSFSLSLCPPFKTCTNEIATTVSKACSIVSPRQEEEEEQTASPSRSTSSGRRRVSLFFFRFNALAPFFPFFVFSFLFSRRTGAASALFLHLYFLRVVSGTKCTLFWAQGFASKGRFGRTNEAKRQARANWTTTAMTTSISTSMFFFDVLWRRHL